MMEQNKEVSAKAVILDLDTCDVLLSEEYDTYQVRQSIESVLEDHLPFTITAIGNLKRIPRSVWKPILSTGIFMKHCDLSHMNIAREIDMLADNNPPPPTLILISDRQEVFEYEFFPKLRGRGYTIETRRWGNIFSAGCNETTSNKVKEKCSETAWVCDICIDSGLTFAGESYDSLIGHFRSMEHIVQEYRRMPQDVLDFLFLSAEKEESSTLAKKTGVWWDLDTCLVPQEYDPYQVRQSIESVLEDYLPFTITAIGDLKRIPPRVLEPIFSTGIFMKHSKPGPKDILVDMDKWAMSHPPPATLILISDHKEEALASLLNGLLPRLRDRGYTIIRAYANLPKVPPPKYSTWLSWKHLLLSDTTSNDKVSCSKNTAVWWHIDSCPVPRGYDPRQVLGRIESAFNNYLPFTSITAFGNLKCTPSRISKDIRSSGFRQLVLKGPNDILVDMDMWATSHPPPATVILISDDRDQDYVASRLIEEGYTILRVYGNRRNVSPRYSDPTTLWKDLLLSDTNQETTSNEVKEKCSLNEMIQNKVSCSKKTAVWWNINSCPVPRGYDPRHVRRRIESTFNKYLPFTSITAIGNLKRTPSRVLEPIRSSGFVMKDDHETDIKRDVRRWTDDNPPPATVILISDNRDQDCVASRLINKGYTILRVYANRRKVWRYSDQKPIWKHLLSDTNQETAWVCNICIESGGTFCVGESYESLTRHFKSVEHPIQDLEKVPQPLIIEEEEEASFLPEKGSIRG